jgi:hypothetical protein
MPVKFPMNRMMPRNGPCHATDVSDDLLKAIESIRIIR